MNVDGLRALRTARDRIDQGYAEPLKVSALAAEMGYSLSHFIRAFNDAYGETPAQFLSRRRIERACELLRSVNLTVTEVCLPTKMTCAPSFQAHEISASLVATR